MGVGLLVGVWVARYLGPEQFGMLNFATAFTSMFAAIAALGLPSIVVRDIVRDPDTKASTLGAAAMLQLIGGFIAYGLCMVAIFILRPEDALTKTLVAILGAVMLFKALDIAVYWFESQVQSKYTVWVQNGVFLVFAIIKVGLILINASLISFAWATLSESILVGFVLLVVMNRHGFPIRHLSLFWQRVKSLLTDSWPLLLSSIAVMVYMKIDQIMLGQMLGDEAVGIYSVAVRISEVWYILPGVILSTIVPSMLHIKNQNEVLYYERLQSLFDLMTVISVSIAILFTFMSTSIIELLFGEKYVEASLILKIHVWGGVFVFLGLVSGHWLVAENIQNIILNRSIVGVIINVISNYFLIPEFGMVGCAYATLISQAMSSLVFDVFIPLTRAIFWMKLRSFNFLRLINGFWMGKI